MVRYVTRGVKTKVIVQKELKYVQADQLRISRDSTLLEPDPNEQAQASSLDDSDRSDDGKTEQTCVSSNGLKRKQKRKMAATRSRRHFLGWFLVLHMPSLTITYALFGVYMAQYEWSAKTAQMNALLFAAKVHESLIAVSLSSILFHRIRYKILNSDGFSTPGVPFGLLTAPFQLSNPLYLTRQPFLASTRLMFKNSTQFITTMLVIISIILASLCGPSSGVVMLPKLDWWPFPNGHSIVRLFQQQNLGDMYLTAPFNKLFPTYIDQSMSPNQLYRSGYEDLFKSRLENLLYGLNQVLVDDNSTFTANISGVEYGTALYSFSLSVRGDTAMVCPPGATVGCKNPTSVSLAVTSPLSIVSQQLYVAGVGLVSEEEPVLIKAAVSSQNLDTTTLKQPRVAFQCSYNTGKEPNGIFTFPPGLFSQNISSILMEPTSQTLFFDQSSVNSNSTLSFSVGFIVPSTYPENTFMCLVDMRWIESEVWVTTSSRYVLQYRSSVAMPQDQTLQATEDGSHPMVTIDPAWAYTINNDLQMRYSDNSGQVSGPFDYFKVYCSSTFGGDSYVPTSLSKKCEMAAYAMLMTDVLRTAPLVYGFTKSLDSLPPSKMNLRQSGQFSKVYMRPFHQVYAYRLEGALLQLSIAVLLLHTMMVYAHLLVVLLGDGWDSGAWSEVGDFIALAVATTKPQGLFKDCSVGVKNHKIWQLRTFVREVVPENRLEFILLDEGSPETNRKECGDTSLPRPDWHYD